MGRRCRAGGRTAERKAERRQKGEAGEEVVANLTVLDGGGGMRRTDER
jgi:hypothetical protein